MIDFQNEEVKEVIGKLASETGMTLEQIINDFKYFEENKRYVRFIKGKYKGEVGIIYPNSLNCGPAVDFMSYAKTVVLPNGDEIWCPRYEIDLEVITKEEYMKESADDV